MEQNKGDRFGKSEFSAADVQKTENTAVMISMEYQLSREGKCTLVVLPPPVRRRSMAKLRK